MNTAFAKKIAARREEFFTVADIPRIARPPKPPARLRRRHLRKAQFGWDLELERYLADPLAIEYGWATPADVPRLKAERSQNRYYEFWSQVDGNSGHILRDFDRIPQMFQDLDRLKRAMPWGFNSTSFSDPHRSAAHLASILSRHYGIGFFGFSIPIAKALHAIAQLDMPVLELGSGRGYWAWLLERTFKVRVLCEEPSPRKWYWRAPDRHTTTGKLPRDHALLFNWPTYGDPWAYHRVAVYQGEVVIHVGEGDGGCTAEPRFYRLLEQNFRLEKEVHIPQWDGLHDSMSIWRRERRKR